MKKKNTVGLMIRAAREKRGIKWEQLARRIKISPSYLRNLAYNCKIPVSDRLRDALLRNLPLPQEEFKKMVMVHRKIVAAHRRQL